MQREKRMEFYIFGYGRVGQTLVQGIRRHFPRDPIIVIDHEGEQLADLSLENGRVWIADAVAALQSVLENIREDCWIIPALPRHLLYEFLCQDLARDHEVARIPVPEMNLELPFMFRDDKGTLYLSYADFTCPPDCSEPEKTCTVTGLPRPEPLYQLLERIEVKPFVSCVVRSVQLAPGLGGYRATSVQELNNRLRARGKGDFLISTSCSCHAVMNGLQLK